MDRHIPTLHLDTVLRDHTRDMTGRIVAITGTTSGTGFICARELAKLGATLVLFNRPSPRAEASLARLLDAVPKGSFEPIPCDLQDFESVRGAARSLRERHDRLDVLCNNAAVMALPDRPTKDGYDVQMQTNALSHFLLTRELWPLLLASDEGRVVNHTSMARLGPPLEARYFERRGGDLGGDASPEGGIGGPRWARYHQTKLANCAFTYELQRRVDARGLRIKALLAHPGLAYTGLHRATAAEGGMDVDHPVMQKAQSAEDGALGILRACADPGAEPGDFFGPPGMTGFPGRLPPEDLLFDPENRRVNWEGCEAAVGAFEV